MNKEGFRIVEIFKYRRRTIVIVEASWLTNESIYHNGYVSCRLSSGEVEYESTYSKITADEATYEGYFGKEWDHPDIPHDLWFLGFDSVHSWNDEIPESKTLESVRERAKRFADDMIRCRI